MKIREEYHAPEIRPIGSSDSIEWLSVSDAMRLLARSRRHIYRYLREGLFGDTRRVGPCFLLRSDRVHALRKQLEHLEKGPFLPPSGKILFPEYSLKSLNPLRHQSIVIGRVLERGTFADIRWALAFYDKATLRDFLRQHGTRLLSPKSLNFWAWYLEMPIEEHSPMRRLGQKLGGVV